MANERGRLMTPLDVAEIWFGTRSPSADQLRKVLARMQSGALPLTDPAAPPARWTTTEKALATFLAARRASKDAAGRGTTVGVASPRASDTTFPTDPHLLHHKNAMLRGAYRNMWSNYFLAVMIRRRVPHASRAFERAVIAGQLIVVAIIAFMVVEATGAWSPGRPLEQQLINDHLATQHGWHKVDQWHQPETDHEGHRMVRVEYRYRDGDSSRVIHTDRRFVIDSDRVAELSPDEEY